MKKNVSVLLVLTAMLVLSACSFNQEGKNKNVNPNVNTSTKVDNNNNNNRGNINNNTSGVVPNGLNIKQNPTYPVGSEVTINAGHKDGMKGAKGIIVGAYDTTAYEVSYKPTTGGNEVKNHKWVVKEEIKNTDNKTLQPGTKVTLDADHMTGMKSAIATIDSSVNTTVYLVNYKPTNGGNEVKNHKWLIESELSPVK